MKEILLSIYDTMKQRLKSPFIGAYIISFLVYNWWPISIYVRSDKKIEDIVKHLTREYSNGLAYLVPLTFAVVYVAALPYINAFFDLIGTKANLFRITNRNEVKHKGLLQDIKTAEYERRIADERAGTKEKEILLLKLEAAEANVERVKTNWADEKKLFQTQSEEFAVKTNELSSDVLKLRNNIGTLENENKSLLNQLVFFDKVYPQLIKMGKNSHIEIAHFLKRYLSEEETIKLKEDATARVTYQTMPYRVEVNALLVKANLYKQHDDNSLFVLTDNGAKFVDNL